MQNDLKQEIVNILFQTRDEIKANMQAEHINASGRTSASIRVVEYDGGVRLVGGTYGKHYVHPPQSNTIQTSDTAPIRTLEFGRKGGKIPKGFFYILLEWTREKGIGVANEQQRRRIAAYLVDKIQREGTERYKHHVDVYSTPVENAKENINNMLKQSVEKAISAATTGVKVTGLRGAFTTD